MHTLLAILSVQTLSFPPLNQTATKMTSLYNLEISWFDVPLSLFFSLSRYRKNCQIFFRPAENEIVSSVVAFLPSCTKKKRGEN